MKKEFLSCNIWTNEAMYFRIFFYFLEEEGEPSTVSEDVKEPHGTMKSGGVEKCIFSR